MHETTTAPQASELAERRCWRCQQMFPGDATAGAAPAREEFWMCPPCVDILLPAKQRPS